MLKLRCCKGSGMISASGYIMLSLSLDRKENSSSSCSRDSTFNESQCANFGLGVNIPSKHSIPIPVSSEAGNVSFQSKLLGQQKEKGGPWFPPIILPITNLPADRTSSSSVTSVTTDLGLGTIYASSSREPITPKLCDHREYLQRFSGFKSSEFEVSESTSYQIIPSSRFSNPSSGGHFDYRDCKSITKALTEKVGWQEEAICAITRAISRCKAGYGRSCGSTARGNIWLTFLGPDKVGKKRIASMLAEIMFGSHEHLISVDLRFHDGSSQLNSVFECQESNDYDVKFRGKTVVDYISMELGKRPHSVVLLENVDKADLLVQNSLSQAVRTGKFADSHGREIGINNMIFVMTSTSAVGNKSHLPQKVTIKFSEERILGAKSWQMKMLIKHAAEGSNRGSEMTMKFSRLVTSTASPVNKRKLDGASDTAEQDFSNEAKKQAHKLFGPSLDLNLPVEETEENNDSGSCGSDSISENSQAWLDDFLDQVDEKVVFKPFNFDGLAEKIVREISTHFHKAFGTEVPLEIDDEVMVQILAASWLSDRSRAVEDWVEEVVGRGFMEARQKYGINVQYIVKLVACTSLLVEERAPGICLPARINL
ncbi:conserved hypothetical protein [Ricinus communis]|uniref:Uncharacterized protein n=1 Tax=Ricinus communis TaxID=3988 RepID=B9TBY1_RICCO|nr:conserved hypothetical protein [Ricinus communis]